MCLRIISMAILLQLLKQAESGCPNDIVFLNATITPQEISSANYPFGYSQSQNCRWLLSATNLFEVVRIRVLDTAVDDHATCGNDYIEARDGEYSWSRQIKRWCGLGFTGELTSSESKLLLIFKTDAQHEDEVYPLKGFRLEYFSVPKAKTEYADVELEIMHYVLFILFAVLVSSIIITAIIIALIRTHNKKQKAKEPPRSPRMFQSQKKRYEKELKNGKPKSGMKRAKVGDASGMGIADSHTLLYSSTSTLTTPV